jgi:hypothetical protein
MKEYMKPTIFIMMLEAEDVITSSSNWQQGNIEENEDIWEDFYN